MVRIRHPSEPNPLPSGRGRTEAGRTTAGKASDAPTGPQGRNTGGASSFALSPLDRAQQAHGDRPNDTRALLRAIMEPTLSATLGRNATADPAFFEVVDAVVDVLLASPEAMALVDKARAELAARDKAS